MNREDKLAYTIEEAAELLSLSRAHVYRLLDQGDLNSISIGRCRRITYGQLVEFIRSKEAASCQTQNLVCYQTAAKSSELKGWRYGNKGR